MNTDEAIENADDKRMLVVLVIKGLADTTLSAVERIMDLFM